MRRQRLISTHIGIINKVVDARNNSVYNLKADVDKGTFMEALVKALFGEIPFAGISPFDL